MAVSCVAVLCVRNEEAHLQRAIGDFVAQGIDVAVIDHGSSDRTPKICASFLGKGLVSLEHLPWTGEFDLTDQLRAKRDLLGRLGHDWVIHADADEWMHTRIQGESLLEGIDRVSRLGYNAINFDEFVFLPGPEASSEPIDCKRELLSYYYFAPRENRLMRAWGRKHALENVSSGGHHLAGADLRLAPESFVLRHYIVLSQRHALEKYPGRVFSSGDLEKGWHGNRINLGSEHLRLPESAALEKLPDWQSVALDRSKPRTRHFWEWTMAERGANKAPNDPDAGGRATEPG